MILQLLKQLPPALGRYIGYHFKRAFGRSPRPVPPTPMALAPNTEATRAAPVALTSARPALLQVDIAAELGAQVAWSTDDADDLPADMRDNALFKIWIGLGGGHKWPHYFTAYERAFAAMRHTSLRVLEIGVFRGSSIKMWRTYFDHPESVIAAIDIDPGCARFDHPASGIHVMIGDQTDVSFLSDVVARFGPFDIIIDDGSHISSHIIRSFNYLFAHGLKKSGIYLVEDLHAGYWTQYRDSELSFIDVAKQMIELMHSHYARVPSIGAYTAAFVPGGSLPVPLLTTMIDEIRFFDSVVVISKAPRPFAPGSILIGS